MGKKAQCHWSDSPWRSVPGDVGYGGLSAKPRATPWLNRSRSTSEARWAVPPSGRQYRDAGVARAAAAQSERKGQVLSSRAASKG